MRYTFTVNYPGDQAVTLVADSDLSESSFLEEIFGWFNGGSGCECRTFRERKMRSLSVNDFVRVNGQWYQCKSMGWQKVTNEFVDQIEKMVVDHQDFKKYGPFHCLSSVMWELNHD